MDVGLTSGLMAFQLTGSFREPPCMALATPESRRGLEVRALKPKLTRQLALVLRRDKPLSRGLRETVAALQKLKRK